MSGGAPLPRIQLNNKMNEEEKEEQNEERKYKQKKEDNIEERKKRKKEMKESRQEDKRVKKANKKDEKVDLAGQRNCHRKLDERSESATIVRKYKFTKEKSKNVDIRTLGV